jgi:glycosyltransferase involved in cell wall biosynthesis
MKDICVSFGIPEKKIIVLNNFIETADYQPTGRQDWAGDYLLYFGRLAYEKGVATIIEAISKLPSSIRLKIAGVGPEEKVYLELIKKYKLEERVELAGFKSGPELQDLIRRAKAVIVPSLWNENWPFSILEAMALGQIVIGSRAGGIPEMLCDGKAGLLFEPGDSAGLAKLIGEVYQNDYSEIGLAARRAAADYDPQKYLQRIVGLYQELIKK